MEVWSCAEDLAPPLVRQSGATVTVVDQWAGPAGGGTCPPFLLQTTTRQTVVRMAMTAHPTAMVMRMPIRGTLELLVLDHLDTAKTNQSLEN